MPAFRAVVFDLGHTLWDYAPTENAHRLRVLRLRERLEAELGDRAPQAAALDQALGATIARWLDAWNVGQLEQPPSEQLVSEALGTLQIDLSAEALSDLTTVFFGGVADMPVVEPDGLAAIATLHRKGLALGCITNTLTLEKGIVGTLRSLGLLCYLESVVVSSAVGYCKPHPSLFLRALDELGVAAGEAVFVGDRLVEDVGGAHRVGMRAVLTHQYRQEQPDGADRAPDAVIQRLSELPRALERIETRG